MIWKINGTNRNISEAKYRMDWSKDAPSKISQTVKDFLFVHCRNYVWYEEFRLPGSLLRVDFLCATKKLAIECDGSQHTNFNKFFHRDRMGYLSSLRRDMTKTKVLEDNGYVLVRIEDKDLPLSREFFENFGVFI